MSSQCNEPVKEVDWLIGSQFTEQTFNSDNDNVTMYTPGTYLFYSTLLLSHERCTDGLARHIIEAQTLNLKQPFFVCFLWKLLKNMNWAHKNG